MAENSFRGNGITDKHFQSTELAASNLSATVPLGKTGMTSVHFGGGQYRG